MSDIDTSINQLKAALESNNEVFFVSCVNKLDTPENEYAFTNLSKHADKEFWELYKKKFDNTLKEDTVHLNNREDENKYMDTDIFLYMYPMVVVEVFFWMRQKESFRKKAYNEFIRRIEDGLSLLYNSGPEGRGKQKIYYERLVQSIIRNCENSVDFKINLLTYVYGLAQYYQYDPKDGRYLSQESIEECMIKPVYEEYKNDNKFNTILDGSEDEIEEYRKKYISVLDKFRNSAGQRAQSGGQAVEPFKKTPEEVPEKSPQKKNENQNDGTAVSFLKKHFPTSLSRCVVTALVFICIVLLVNRAFSSDSNSNGKKGTNIGTEQNSIETSAFSNDEEASESQNDYDQSSAVTETKSDTDSSGDKKQSQPTDEPERVESMPTNNDDRTPLGHLIIARDVEDENSYRNMRKAPNTDNDQNVILRIPGGTTITLLDELEESWLYVEYSDAANENGHDYKIECRGYIKIQDGDERIE